MLIDLNKLIKKYKLKIIGISHFGAHLGQEVSIYNELNINNVHLFEPQKKIFETLKTNLGTKPNIKFYNYGLGSENKIVQLYLDESDGQSSSILEPLMHLEMNPNVSFQGKEEIEIKRYDDLLIDNVNFLNIDIQGYELEALKGAYKILHNIDYIYLEVNRDYVYKDCSLVKDIDDFLKQFNFYRFETKWWKGFYIWGDAFYINLNRNKVNSLNYLFSKFRNFIQRFSLYFSFMKFYELVIRKTIYRVKQKIKKIILK